MNTKKHHNTIVICSDEHNFGYMGCAGHPYVKTPNLDALAHEGTMFTRAYSNCPVCTPSRMSFITGKYVSQIGSWFIGVPLSEQESTWPRRLSQAGVHTTMIGKMDFCGSYQSGGFDDYKVIERRGAYSPYPRTSPLPSRLPGYVRADKRMHLRNAGIRKPLYTNGADGHHDALGFYDHDRMVTQWALEYLDGLKSRRKDEPWTLYLGYLMPHWPFTCPEEYFNMYYPDHIEMPFDCVLPENPSLHPAVREFQRACDYRDITQEDIRRVIASYCGMITAMDDMLGQVFEKLRSLGIYDDINIMYTSDHGESCGEHGLFYKQCAYNGSCAVPLIMKGPDIKRGNRVDTPVTLADMYPTLLSLWGLETEPDRPGKSWIPLLQGNKEYGMPYAFSEYHGNFFPNDWYMLVRNQYKYVYYLNGNAQLFDLDEDPHEIHDLAGDTAYAQILKSFEETLRHIVNPEKVSMQSKKALGLIGADGEDYTQTLQYNDFLNGLKKGLFPNEPEFVQFKEYFEEH